MRSERDEDFRDSSPSSGRRSNQSNQNMNQGSGRSDRDRSSSPDRYQAEDDNYSMRNREPQQRYSDNFDEETPRRSRGQTESWSEDIDEDIESPRSTPRHASMDSSNAKSNQGRGLRANQSQNQNWGDVTDEGDEFDEADEDMYASGNNEEDEEDYDEEEDHRSNSRRPHY